MPMKSKCINADSARVAKHIIYLVGLNRASRDHEIWRRNYSPASWERNQTWRRRRPSLLLLLGAMREWRILNTESINGWHGGTMITMMASAGIAKILWLTRGMLEMQSH